jgi:hypothetical protein
VTSPPEATSDLFIPAQNFPTWDDWSSCWQPHIHKSDPATTWGKNMKLKSEIRKERFSLSNW